MPSVVLRSAWPRACDTAELGGEGVASEVHVEAVGDVAADEPRGLQLPVPPAMNGLRARALLRVRANGEQLLALRTAAVVDLLRRVEQEVVRLGRAAGVGEIGAEEEPELGEHGTGKGKDPFLAALAVRTERAAVSVEVANLDTGELASSNAEEEQAESARRSRGWLAIVRSLGRASAGRSGATRFSARGRRMRAAGEMAM
jgi:hypothetical protein